MTKLRGLAAIVAGAGLLSGCGIFGGDRDESLEPKELVGFEETLDVRRAWSARLGGGTEFLRLSLSPAGDGERIFAASADGTVTAFDAESGRRLWRTDVDFPISAGPGAGENRVVVAGRDGHVACLRADDGSEIWRSFVAGESLSKPVIRNDSVIVYTIDGNLQVLSRFNGREIWSLSQGVPPLTLRGSASPVVVGSTVVAGFDNGRLIASALSDGVPRWEIVLSPPTGRSDLERLADVDGKMAVAGQDVFASGYNGRLAAIAVESGQVIWAREISSYAGLDVDDDNVYAVTDSGEVIALSRRSGNDRWRQDALLRREPTAPVAFGEAVVVGDLEGYVHFFAASDGRPLARRRVGKGMLAGEPQVIDGRLYVQSESGRLEVFALPAQEGSAAVRDEAVAVPAP